MCVRHPPGLNTTTFSLKDTKINKNTFILPVKRETPRPASNNVVQSLFQVDIKKISKLVLHRPFNVMDVEERISSLFVDGESQVPRKNPSHPDIVNHMTRALVDVFTLWTPYELYAFLTFYKSNEQKFRTCPAWVSQPRANRFLLRMSN